MPFVVYPDPVLSAFEQLANNIPTRNRVKKIVRIFLIIIKLLNIFIKK